MTADQLFALASQLTAMAKAVEAKRETLVPGSAEALLLQQQRLALTNESGRLLAPAIHAALDELAPHYDAMLSVVHDLNHQIAEQQKITKILSLVSSALAIAAAVQMGNPAALLKAVGDARAVLA